jgi:hypothetical protein
MHLVMLCGSQLERYFNRVEASKLGLIGASSSSGHETS